jgi:hypothetical protein
MGTDVMRNIKSGLGPASSSRLSPLSRDFGYRNFPPTTATETLQAFSAVLSTQEPLHCSKTK